MVAQVVDEVGEQRPGLPGVREVAARRGHTVARLEDVAHGGACLLGKRLRIGRIGNRGIVLLLPLALCGTCSGNPLAQRRPPEKDVCLSLWER